jgi:hypothetical protein
VGCLERQIWAVCDSCGRKVAVAGQRNVLDACRQPNAKWELLGLRCDCNGFIQPALSAIVKLADLQRLHRQRICYFKSSSFTEYQGIFITC